MSDAIWYYAHGDKEQGPVSTAQIKTLVQTGKIKAEDLVWREGLDDWLPAGKVPELYTPAELPLPEPAPQAAAAGRGKAPAAEAAPRIEAPARGAGPASAQAATPAPPPAPAGPAAAPPPASGESPAHAETRPRASGLPSISLSVEPRKLGRLLGWPLLIVGLFLVMLSKGCDATGNRWVARLQAMSDTAQSTFDDESNRQKNEILLKKQVLEDKKDSSPKDVGTIAELGDKLKKLDEETAKLRAQKQIATWPNLAASHRAAEASNRMWSYWRELLFVFGSLVLTAGLLAVGVTGEGAEKWICLIMLAIITLSLYVGGMAWMGVPFR